MGLNLDPPPDGGNGAGKPRGKRNPSTRGEKRKLISPLYCGMCGGGGDARGSDATIFFFFKNFPPSSPLATPKKKKKNNTALESERKHEEGLGTHTQHMAFKLIYTEEGGRRRRKIWL